MHQTSCRNGFPILEKEGLEGVDIFCKPLILAEHKQVRLACCAGSDSGLCSSVYEYVYPVYSGCGVWDGGFSNQGVLLLQLGLCWHNVLSHGAAGICGSARAA